MKHCAKLSNLFFALAIVWLAACQPPQPTATPTPAKTQATPAIVSTAAPALAATEATAQANPLDTAWDDRTSFRKGLINAEQDVLNRLPGASVYHIDLRISDDYAVLQGTQQVRFTNQETQPLDEVYFRLFANAIGGKATVSDVKVDGQGVEPVYESQNTAVRVPLAAPLPPGQQIVIQMGFKVQVPKELGGSYGLLSYLDGVLALDSFYPSIPAYDDKGWYAAPPPPNADLTYADASFYLVRVTAPAKLKLATSGIEIHREAQGNRQVITFAAGPARDFYIAASETYVVLSETLGETRVNSYASAERAEAAKQALRNAVAALKTFSARFGAYPYTEFDVAAISMLALGIEYPGITGITLKAYDPGNTISGLPAPAILESTVAHEVGHQWFYSTVGNDQVNEPWLDEAVTQYVTGLYYEDMYGQAGAQSYRASWESRWARVNRANIPIGLPVAGYTENEYSPIVYGRGPIVLMGMAQKIGQETFDAFLREYYTAHKWGIGTGAAFEQLLERQCQCDLTPIFKEQVYGKAN
jgi:aminopeptidase N